MKNYFLRNGVLYIILILVTIAVINMFANPATDTQQLAYNEYRQQLTANKLTDIKVQLDGGTYHIEGKFKDQPNKSFVTRGPANYGSTVLQDLQNANVKVTYEKPKGDSIWITLFTYIIPFVVILFLFFFLLNQAQGGGSRVMNFGKSKAKLYNEEKRRVTFDDVAGADEEKAELVEIVDFLKDNRRYAQMGHGFRKGFFWSDRREQENFVGQGGGRRSESSVLFHQRFGLCGNVCRGGGIPCS